MFGQLFFYQLSIGNIFWIYVGSIACEKGVALAGGVNWSCFLLASFFTQTLYEDLTPSGMFLMFGCISTVGLFVYIIAIKETQGQLKEDSEQLYVSTRYKKVDRNSLLI